MCGEAFKQSAWLETLQAVSFCRWVCKVWDWVCLLCCRLIFRTHWRFSVQFTHGTFSDNHHPQGFYNARHPALIVLHVQFSLPLPSQVFCGLASGIASPTRLMSKIRIWLPQSATITCLPSVRCLSVILTRSCDLVRLTLFNKYPWPGKNDGGLMGRMCMCVCVCALWSQAVAQCIYTPRAKDVCRNEIWTPLLDRRSCFIKETMETKSILNAPKIEPSAQGRLYITLAITPQCYAM